ncbi:MAG: IPT/TIG domain-containing protein [Chloroflexi bacterium]|nr:IPT/TIG domain-containing protein [Chloroflexota bacterium]
MFVGRAPAGDGFLAIGQAEAGDDPVLADGQGEGDQGLRYREDGMKCTACGAEVREGETFCQDCGAAAPAFPPPTSREGTPDSERRPTPPWADSPSAEGRPYRSHSARRTRLAGGVALLLLAIAAGWLIFSGRGAPIGIPGSSSGPAVAPISISGPTTLKPSNEIQAFSYQGEVVVIVPGGLLKAPQTLSIAPVATAPAPNSEDLKQVALYDVSLGDLHELEKEIVIEVAYGSAVKDTDLVWLEYWDEAQKAWVMLPSEADRQKKVVRATTRHLSLVSVISAEEIAGLQGKEVAEGNKGKWYYRNEYFRMEFNKAEVEAGTGPKAGWYTKPDPKVKPVQADMPRYVEDIWAYLNTGRERYQKAGLRELPKFDFTGFLSKHGTFVYVGGSGSSNRSKITGSINISLDSAGSPELLNATVAHELFHSVQNLYYTAAGMTARKWWMEATADYAADRIAMGGSNMMGGNINPRFLEKSLTYSSSVLWDAAAATGVVADDPHGYHEYTAAYFIDFLVNKKGFNFAEMWNKVAEYYSPNIDAVLEEYLLSKKMGLPQVYREFSRYWLFDPQSPVYTRVGVKDLSSEVGEPGLPKSMAADQDEVVASFSMDASQSAKLWALKVAVSPQGGKPGTRKLTVDADVPAEVDVYRLKAGATGRPGLAGSMESAGKGGGRKAVDVEAEDGDTLYVVAYNFYFAGSISASVKVTAIDPLIKSVNPATAWYDDEVTLAGKNFGPSQGNSRLTLYGVGNDWGLVIKATSWSDTQIKLKVPRGVLVTDSSKEPTGDVEVVVDVRGAAAPAGLLSNRAKLTIGKPGPKIASVSPQSGMLGQEVTISGSGFGATQGNSTITFHRTTVASNSVNRNMITSWSDKELRVKVPDNTWSGDVVVKVGGVESNRQRFELDLPAHLKQMTNVSIVLRGVMTYRTVSSTGETSRTDQRDFEVVFPLSASSASVQGNTLKAAYQETRSDGTVVSYSLAATFDAGGERLLSADVTKTMQRPDYSDSVQFKVGAVPAKSDSPTTFFYQVTGTEVGTHVLEVKHDLAWLNSKQTSNFVSANWSSLSMTLSRRP